MNNRHILWIVEVTDAAGNWWPIFKDHVYATREGARKATQELREEMPKKKYRYNKWIKED
jgi:hypothetical protein